MKADGLMYGELVAHPRLDVLAQDFAIPVIHFQGQRGEALLRHQIFHQLVLKQEDFVRAVRAFA
jgi:hypothetical protein